MLMGFPSPVTAQQAKGELFGLIRCSSSADGSLGLVTVDLINDGNSDGLIDTGFVIVRPGGMLVDGTGVGRVILPGPTRHPENAYIELLVGGLGMITIRTRDDSDDEPQDVLGTPIDALRIFRFEPAIGVKMNHAELGEFLFKRDFWERLRLKR
jgi:hypothetical protein